MLSYSRPLLTVLNHRLFSDRHITAQVLHEYGNHETVSGNKWWKLKGNLEQALKEKHDTILTFGGAYSNHIYATAAAAKQAGLKSIGIIRGEKVKNKTLDFAELQGMKLVFVSREWYRVMSSGIPPEMETEFELEFGRTFIIPQGGTNEYAVDSCTEWGRKLRRHAVDKIYLPVGTAGTISGLICGGNESTEVIGVPVLKNNGFLDEAINKLTQHQSGRTFDTWRLLNDYHFGGYGKSTNELNQFCEKFKTEHGIVIEPIYTGKLFSAVFDQAAKGLIPQGSNILIIHTGGLQYLA